MSSIIQYPVQGTWTPAWQGAGGQTGQVYVAQNGNWIRNGNQVFIMVNITLSTLGTITGALRMGGLPFAASATAQGGIISCGYFNTLGTAVLYIVGRVIAAQLYFEINQMTAGSTSISSGAQATLAATSDVYMSGSYIAA